jgi:hypothetical protein
MALKTKCLMGLIGLSVVDTVIPLPILGLVLIYVILQKSPWFYEVVCEIYRE